MRQRRAHPRAGGENDDRGKAVVADNGSSPRGRGKLTALTDTMLRRRLIPARAGKTRR